MMMYYLYGMRLRGASPGAQPKGFEIMTEFYEAMFPGIARRYHDILKYPRLLTDDELKDYELDYLGRISK